jgi:hypothetical protein
MTWAMTGEMPQGWKDYIYPRTGGKNADGTPARSNTMYYTREFGGLAQHAQIEGVTSGLVGTVASKGSGLIALANEGIKGVDEWGDQIRDPNAPAYKQLEQTLAHALQELEPISMSAIKGPIGFNKETALSVTGFSPAGKYITQDLTKSRIDATYNKTYASREQPFERAEYSKDSQKLRDLYNSDQIDKYDAKVAEMQETYKLTGAELRKLTRGIQKGTDTSIKKFSGFAIGDQKALLDRMTSDERETYLRHANKKLRREYEAPVE